MKRLGPIQLLAGAALLLLAGSIVLGGGSAPLGRVFLSAGLPRLAAPFFSDPAWRGVAFYRAGQADAAAGMWQGQGGLNLGNALVHQGRYAEALEAYDAARFAGDVAAARNFDLVASFYAGQALAPGAAVLFTDPNRIGPNIEASVGQGNARAASTGEGATNRGTLLGLPELESRGRLGVRKVFDARFVTADTRWLETLQDVPGNYLAARIAFEHKRRARAGLSPDAENTR